MEVAMKRKNYMRLQEDINRDEDLILFGKTLMEQFIGVMLAKQMQQENL